jgi:hypothetical protein
MACSDSISRALWCISFLLLSIAICLDDMDPSLLFCPTHVNTLYYRTCWCHISIVNGLGLVAPFIVTIPALRRADEFFGTSYCLYSLLECILMTGSIAVLIVFYPLIYTWTSLVTSRCHCRYYSLRLACNSSG